MTRSLRGRLLIGVISLVVIGLLISDIATYAALQTFLVKRIDDQLASVAGNPSGRQLLVNVLTEQQGRGPGSPTQFAPGTVVEEVSPSGAVLTGKAFFLGPAPAAIPLPVLPHTLPNVGIDKGAPPFSVGGTNGVSQFRIVDWPEDQLQGNFIVLAIPLTEVRSTLSQLLLLEATISLLVVAATAILALLIIRIGLRPLQQMGTVAADIAAGDLSRRVEPATPQTEIGRLGLALNGMLSQIEAAFAERTASNDRLRRVIADASHELRTPLTSIRGYAEMLRRGASESPRDSEAARRRIEEESIRMTGLVDDLLVLARLDQGRPLEKEPVDLRAIATDAVADARVVAPQRQISLSANGPVIVTGDDTRLRQVLGNLVRNALVHTPQQTPVEIAVVTADGVGRMSVADHGPGLTAEDVERIFEPFFRADPSRSRDSGGAGLGLSIVSAVVTAHGGHVKVSQTEGGGATFEVELPLAR
ncbi:MAG TPA: ATP-binding protein [Candidatus Limnocylindria bacterium]|jgi:two-component system OmpR family sensor kinase|nr:ATP-binding protein [Candidatus Limnocylindria bacterium]